MSQSNWIKGYEEKCINRDTALGNTTDLVGEGMGKLRGKEIYEALIIFRGNAGLMSLNFALNFQTNLI